MAKDFFGYNRNIKSKELLSSDFAIINVAGTGRMGLVQSCNATYQQRVEPKFEAGSSDLYWVNGQPSGTVGMQRLVGKSGLFYNVNKVGCGELQTLSINTAGNSCGISVQGNGVTFEGAILQSIGLNIATGSLEIQDSLNYLVAAMNV